MKRSAPLCTSAIIHQPIFLSNDFVSLSDDREKYRNFRLLKNKTIYPFSDSHFKV